MYVPMIGQRVMVDRVRKGIVYGTAQIRGQDVVYVEWDARHPETGAALRDTIPLDRITSLITSVSAQ